MRSVALLTRSGRPADAAPRVPRGAVARAPTPPRAVVSRVLLLAVMAALACAHPERRPEAPGTSRRQEGLASYYGGSFHGRRTASGDPYDANAMTCAHPTLAFGTVLRVTDVETGKSVDVTVNDRGPYGRGRIVDLSWAAARALGILERGVARVIVEVIRPAR